MTRTPSEADAPSGLGRGAENASSPAAEEAMQGAQIRTRMPEAGWSLRTKFLVALFPFAALLIVSALIIPAYASFLDERRALESKLRRMIENQAIILSRSAAETDPHMTALVNAGLFADRDLVFAEIRGVDGAVLSRLGQFPQNGQVREQPLRYVEAGEIIEVGSIRMGITFERAWQDFRRWLLMGSISAVLALAGIWVSTDLLFRSVIGRRLKALQRGIDRWRVGLPTHLPLPERGDELARLTATFADLHAERIEHERAIEQARSELESRVEERTRALAEARDEAERASAAKAGFIAAVSHEIRTPMNAILGVAQSLDSAQLSPIEREKVGLIRESGENLMLLLDDVLDLSKVDAGHMEVRPEPIDLRAFLAGLAALWRVRAEQKGLVIALDVAPEIPSILLDPLRLRQAVGNLLSNAVKFTENGRITIRAAGEKLGPGRWRVMIEVQDTGIGISAEARQRIFATFGQGDTSTARRFGGTGLGLALTQRIVGLMDGRVEVESEQGRGSLFCIVFDNVQAAMRTPGDIGHTAIAPSTLLSGRRLLVVDDVVTNRLVVRLMLEPVGCTVAEATSGAEAITLLAVGERYDLALVDLHMPEMDGIEVVRRMRGVPGGDRLPIVLLTADVTEEARSRAIDAGVAGFLTKPIDYDRAMAEMAKHLQDSVLRPSAGTRETA